MNTKILAGLMGLSVAVLFSSCATPLQKRLESNPKIYAELSEKHQAEVMQGKVSIGMPKEAVFLSWGRPNRAAKQQEKNLVKERWSYTSYDSVVHHRPGYSMAYYDYPYGYGYRGFYDSIWYEPTIEYVPYESKSVEFINQKVTKFSLGGQ